MLRVVMHAAQAAGSLCRTMQPEVVAGVRAGAGEHKADGSDITIADYASQALLIHLLARTADMPCVVAEESAHALAARADLLASVTRALARSGLWPGVRPSDVLEALAYRAWDPASHANPNAPTTYWTIDPIDGTKGYAAGRQFAVCVALIDHGAPVLGVLDCPNLPLDGAQALLAEGQAPGTITVTGTTIGCISGGPVLQARDGTLAPIAPRHPQINRPPVFTFAVEPSEGRVTDLRRIGQLLGSLGTPLACDSQAKYALVARGDADVYYRPPRKSAEKVWDHAAGCLLLQSAGCTVTDVRGRPIDWSSPVLAGSTGVLGAPPALHARVLAALGQA